MFSNRISDFGSCVLLSKTDAIPCSLRYQDRELGSDIGVNSGCTRLGNGDYDQSVCCNVVLMMNSNVVA